MKSKQEMPEQKKNSRKEKETQPQKPTGIKKGFVFQPGSGTNQDVW